MVKTPTQVWTPRENDKKPLNDHCGAHAPLMNRIEEFTASVKTFVDTSGDVKAIRATVEGMAETVRNYAKIHQQLFDLDRHRGEEIHGLQLVAKDKGRELELLISKIETALSSRITTLETKDNEENAWKTRVRDPIFVGAVCVAVTALIVHFVGK